MKFRYGRTQLITGNMYSRFPQLAKLIFTVFGYTNIGNHARAIVFKRLIHLLPYAKFKKILDLGCGYGEFTCMLAESLKEAEFTALDIDTERLAQVDKLIVMLGLKNVATFNGEISKINENNQYDLIFSVDVFEHILEAQMPFEQCYLKLKPGGFLIVKMPNITQSGFLPQSWFKEHNAWLDDEHVGQVLNLDGLRKKFEANGFEIFFQSYSDGRLSRLAWEIGYFAKKGGNIFHLLFLPVSKLLIWMDNWTPVRKSGNAIQIIGQKPY